MKDAKGHGSDARGDARGFDGEKRFGNSALKGYGVNSPAMMEARAAQELARGNPKADAAPVHGGTGGDSFFGRSPSGAAAANKEAQDFQATRATSGPHYLGANDPRGSGRSGYNAHAVNNAIASSNRAGRRIGGREAKMIHALLKGRG